MGKGARNRGERKDAKVKAYELFEKNPVARKAFEEEVGKRLILEMEQFYEDNTALILMTLHEEFGFGQKRLERFMRAHAKNLKKLQEYYECGDLESASYAEDVLRNAGIDLTSINGKGE